MKEAQAIWIFVLEDDDDDRQKNFPIKIFKNAWIRCIADVKDLRCREGFLGDDDQLL